MKTESIVLNFERYSDSSELKAQERMLLERAHKATANSYSPYSKFSVGAAVLLENGEVVEGSNIENSAFPSGLCAERVALFAASAKYPDSAVVALAISAKSTEKITDPVMPCGACCQVMIGIEKKFRKPFRIICQGEVGEVFVFDGASTLLPFAFDEKYL